MKRSRSACLNRYVRQGDRLKSAPVSRLRSYLIMAMWVLTSARPSLAEAIKLHPDNPHYFLFRGRPTVLITSGEHYGAVLNRDFDYITYLNELQSKGLNLTRTFSGGPYREIPASFNIAKNTLAPAPNRFSCVWAKSSTPGYAAGGNKFDLQVWNEAHLARLKDFVAQAGKRGVVVEMNLFTPYYNEELWNVSPLKETNNVNAIGNVASVEALTLKNPALLAVEDAMVRKIVTELNDFDNVYYEVCNEPYFGGVTQEWQDHITSTIVETEALLSSRHLISHNIANGSTKIVNPKSAVSIFNFHYSRPPESVGLNYGLKTVIGLNETGFDGPADVTYRIQGWEFILAGGGLYNNLDYSFTVDHPDGTFVPPESTPGGGSPALRSQLKILKEFIHGFNFVKMAPNDVVIKGGLPSGAMARALVEAGKAYAIYIHHGTPGYSHNASPPQSARSPYAVQTGKQQLTLRLDIPRGGYRAEWVNTKTGHIDKAENFNHPGGNKTLVSPTYSEDIALRVRQATPAN